MLHTTLELLKLKATNGWSDSSFSTLLKLLAELLPKPNGLPTNTYQAKNLLCPFTLGVQKFHSCPDHCILYRKEHESLERCPTCNVSHYKKNSGGSDEEIKVHKSDKVKKKKGRKRKKNNNVLDQHAEHDRKVPALVMWYLPVIDRLKRMFSNPRDAELLVWHFDKRKKDGKLRHPADARQWKSFDLNNPNFSSDPRNLRIGLSTDGMNPFGEMTNPHSTWPVILCLFNLPPWLCHKRKYLMLTTLISGPRQPGNDIDVFLEESRVRGALDSAGAQSLFHIMVEGSKPPSW